MESCFDKPGLSAGKHCILLTYIESTRYVVFFSESNYAVEGSVDGGGGTRRPGRGI